MLRPSNEEVLAGVRRSWAGKSSLPEAGGGRHRASPSHVFLGSRHAAPGCDFLLGYSNGRVGTMGITLVPTCQDY